MPLIQIEEVGREHRVDVVLIEGMAVIFSYLLHGGQLCKGETSPW
jgi:hypothetical protein